VLKPRDRGLLNGMPIPVMLGELERLAERAGMKIHYEDLNDEEVRIRGGHCRLHKKRLILIDPRSGEMDRLKILIRALKETALDGLYILPAIRELIEGAPEG
jgi:hypothetical protein